MLEVGQRIAFERDGEEGEDYFYVLDQVTLGGKNYILVLDHGDGDEVSLETDEDDEEYVPCEALILEEVSVEGEELNYQIVNDEGTLAVLANLFQEQVGNLEIDLSDE